MAGHWLQVMLLTTLNSMHTADIVSHTQVGSAYAHTLMPSAVQATSRWCPWCTVASSLAMRLSLKTCGRLLAACS